jgi:hypothetical protein
VGVLDNPACRGCKQGGASPSTSLVIAKSDNTAKELSIGQWQKRVLYFGAQKNNKQKQ